MQITTEEVEYCKLNVHYEADPEAIISKRNEVINKFRELQIPGFRKGKASPEAVRIYFKKQIEENLKKELANEAVQNVLFEKNIKPFGHPNFSSMNLEFTKFACDFSIFTQPTFELNNYKGFEIPKPQQSVDANELAQKIVQDLRVKHGITTEFNENSIVEDGNNIVVDYNSTVDGQPIERLTAAGELVVVGKTPIPGFDENLLGMKIGEEKSFTITMPQDISDSLAGKEITFNIKLVLGSKVEPAALDDNLAKTVGFDNMQAFMEQAVAVATNRVAELNKTQILDQISRRLITNHEFKIPDWISSAEASVNAKNNGENWDVLPDLQREKYIEHAANSIKLSLILTKIRDNEPEAQLSDDEVFKMATENISKFSENPNQVLENVFKNGHLPVLINRIRDEYTLAFVEKNCTLTE